MNPALLAVVTTRLGRNEPTLTRVAGGDINDAYEARWPGGDRLFIKTRKGLAGDAYRTEADGLRWLTEARALRIPKVVAQSAPGDPIAFLALEHMARSAPALDHDDRLGDGLAALHAAGAAGFGYAEDNSIGSLPQSNQAHGTWTAFYAEERVLPLVRRAIDGGHVPASWGALADRLAARLPELGGPPEPPARLSVMTLPLHRSPCSRAGGSTGPASSGNLAASRSASAAHDSGAWPPSIARRTSGSTRSSA